MATNINTPLYLVTPDGTTAQTITLTEADRGKYNTAVIINTSTDPVFVVTGPLTLTAVYPAASNSASKAGDLFLQGRSTVRINPTDGFISLIRKAGASAADVGISLGADY